MPLQVFYWPTSSFLLTHFNHFKFFSDPLQPLQVFQWPTSTTSSFSVPLQVFYWPTSTTSSFKHLEPHFCTTSTIFWVLFININDLEQENFENSTFWKTNFNHISLRAIFWYYFNYFLSSTYHNQLFGARKFWKFNFLKDPLQPNRHLEPHFATTSTIFGVLHININDLEQENFENSTFWKTHFNHTST